MWSTKGSNIDSYQLSLSFLLVLGMYVTPDEVNWYGSYNWFQWVTLLSVRQSNAAGVCVCVSSQCTDSLVNKAQQRRN